MRIIGGKYRGKKLPPPESLETRPTSDRARETLFNVLLHNPVMGPLSLQDKAVLDVFAGTGALGLEALSRGAKTVMFVEKNPLALKILTKTLSDFSLSLSCLIQQDATLLETAPFPFDLVFLDPPYDQGLVTPTLFRLFEKEWFKEQAIVVLEVSKKETLSLPPFLNLILERKEGAANFLFCRVL